MAEIYITQSGKKEKEERLEYLKTVRRPEVLEKLKVAREYGDLSENSEYDAARAEQGRVESEINMIEETLRLAIIVADDELKNDRVRVGSTVTVFDEEMGKQIARNRLLEKYYKIRLNYLQYIGDELSKQIDVVEDQMNYSWLRYNDYVDANKEIRQKQ